MLITSIEKQRYTVVEIVYMLIIARVRTRYQKKESHAIIVPVRKVEIFRMATREPNFRISTCCVSLLTRRDSLL